MIGRFKLWFADRSLREQRLLMVMAGLGVLTFAWAAVIRPVGDALSAARERHADAVILLAETRARLDMLEDIQRQHPVPLTGDLDAVVRERANEAGFALASVSPPAAGQVQISIATARPGPLFGWLADLEASGVLVDSLSTSDNGDNTISAQIGLKARGP